VGPAAFKAVEGSLARLLVGSIPIHSRQKLSAISSQASATGYQLRRVSHEPLAACRVVEITPKLHMIQDPASKLRPKEEVKIVRYMVDEKDWKRMAEEAE